MTFTKQYLYQVRWHF